MEGGSEHPHGFALDCLTHQRMQGIVRSELHGKAKLARKHVFLFDKLDEAELRGVKIHEYIEVAVGAFLTTHTRAVDIERLS